MSNANSCPNCRVRVTGTNPCFFARESIGSLQVKCLNGHSIGDDQASKRRRGNDGEAAPPENCTWIGKCEDAMAHQNVCSFKMIMCEWEVCSHQCMRKYMNDHLSGDGSLRHMNLMKQYLTASFHSEIERVTRSITASYELKIAEMREEIKEMKEHYDQSVRRGGNRQNTSDNEDEMIVSGCGIPVINGRYKKIGLCDRVPKYSKMGRWEGREEEFLLFRCKLSDGNRRWYISIVPRNSK
jgi:hypothetical protein